MRPELKTFLKEFAKRPHRVVALAPSSRQLAEAMVAPLPLGDGPIVELGPGTGVFTEALLRAGVDRSDLHLFELNRRFVHTLRTRFRGLKVHHAPAQTMAEHGLGNLRAVVSGLPLLSMPPRIQREIVEASFRALRPGAPFIQFTYGPRPPIGEDLRLDLNLSWSMSRMVWNNLPPARVYAFRQVIH